MAEEDLAELRKKYKKETDALIGLCKLIPWGPEGKLAGLHPGCNILNAAMFSAKSTLPKGSPRRVFVQDLAAALDRRKLVSDVKKFEEKGYEYMEA